MIFATVGTQLPFDRMIKALDFYSINQSANKVFAQIGKAGKAPKNIEFSATLNPLQFAKKVAKCKVIVSHAGMGTILTGLKVQKPVIIMPRLSRFGEHRNDHQLATAANFENKPGIHVAKDEAELTQLLYNLNKLTAGTSISDTAQPALLNAITNFISTANGEVSHV